MSLLEKFQKSSRIPDLGSFHEQIMSAGNEGRPSPLAWKCELAYACDHDLSVLRFVAKHRLNAGFRYKNIDAYDAIKQQKRFGHELLHVCLGHWLNTLDYNLLFWDAPAYDGNQQAECLVIPMEIILERVLQGCYDYILSSHDCDSYTFRVPEFAKSKNKENLLKQARIYNKTIEKITDQDLSVTVFEYIYMGARDEYTGDKPKKQNETRLGEVPLKPFDSDIPEEFMITPKLAGGFFDAYQAVHTSIAMTVKRINDEINPDDGVLEPRTVDMILRTLKVRDLREIVETGQPMMMRHGRTSLFASIDKEEKKKYFSQEATEKLVSCFSNLFRVDLFSAENADNIPLLFCPVSSPDALDQRIEQIQSLYMQTKESLDRLRPLYMENKEVDLIIGQDSFYDFRLKAVVGMVDDWDGGDPKAPQKYLEDLLSGIEQRREAREKLSHAFPLKNTLTVL